jgi:hypothetical protein
VEKHLVNNAALCAKARNKVLVCGNSSFSFNVVISDVWAKQCRIKLILSH